jgi:hypothetical protein
VLGAIRLSKGGQATKKIEYDLIESGKIGANLQPEDGECCTYRRSRFRLTDAPASAAAASEPPVTGTRSLQGPSPANVS